jgi:Sensors of blue-light using FAD
MLRCIAYVSSALHPLSEAELEALLLDARRFNQHVAVTGVLLFHDGSFFQYFEGPPAGVEAVYARVKASRSHHMIIELHDAPIDERLFGQWLMGFTHAPASELLTLQNAQWRRASRALSRQTGALSPGAFLLQAFWRTCGGRSAPLGLESAL